MTVEEARVYMNMPNDLGAKEKELPWMNPVSQEKVRWEFLDPENIAIFRE